MDHNDANDSGLVGYVPLAEEILLSKCEELSDRDKSALIQLASKARAGTLKAEEQKIWDELVKADTKNYDCQDGALAELRRDAFAREFQ